MGTQLMGTTATCSWRWGAESHTGGFQLDRGFTFGSKLGPGMKVRVYSGAETGIDDRREVSFANCRGRKGSIEQRSLLF